MSAVQPFYLLLGMNTCQILKNEIFFLEAELFLSIYEYLNETMKLDFEGEDAMLESKFIPNIVKDILLTGEYNLSGIAIYTNMPEEVIYEIIIGRNTNPSFQLARKIMELHRTVRPKLYRDIFNKIVQTAGADYSV